MKKIYFIFTLLTIGYCSSVTAQNLVPNSGFEVQDTCPAVSEIMLAQPWHSPTNGTPDLFNTSCSSQQGSPKTGIGCAGLFTYSTFPDNREYIQVQLTSPLQAGETYMVSFYAKRNDFFTYAVDRIGAHLSTTAISQGPRQALTAYPPQIENPAGNVLSGTGYNLISGMFTASGGEEYLIIGNFQNDANTNNVDIEGNSNMASFYYIDDVSVSWTNSVNDLPDEANVNVYPNPSTGVVTVDILSRVPAAKLYVDITDVNGKIIRQENYGSVTQKTLDLSELEKGMYTISVYSQEKYIAHKRVVLR